MSDIKIEQSVKLRRDIINLMKGKNKTVCGTILMMLFVEMCDKTNKKDFLEVLGNYWDSIKGKK